MPPSYFYIKERHNPQLKKPYFRMVGRMTVRDAKKIENPLYGSNIMHKFKTEDECKAALIKFEQTIFD